MQSSRNSLGFLVWAGALCASFAFGCAEAPAPVVAPTPAVASAAPPSAPAPATPASTPAPDYRAIVDAPDRSPEDRALDAGRHPLDLLQFADLRPGMKVAEIAAGGGYTTELLARTVGPTGVVYGQNSKFILERFAEKPWSERLSKPVMKNVVRVDSDFSVPFPATVTGLDAVVDVLFYHDTVWQGADRASMNQTIFRALRPGGLYLIVDHSARPGSGVKDVETLHRIEEQVVKDEITAAGFKLARSADFLRSPSDTRDWSASPRVAGERRGTSDRFVLAFVKP
jgi:predicted methyltransferase